MLLRVLILVVALIAAFRAAGAVAPREHLITVCDLVKRIDALNGRIVRVRGTVVISDTEPDSAPDYLTGTCPGLREGIIRVKINFPDVWFLKKPPEGFRVDKGSFVRSHKSVISAMKDGNVKDRYIATITGLAYAPPPPSIEPPPGLHVTREGSYDAGLVIEGMYDVEIHKP